MLFRIAALALLVSAAAANNHARDLKQEECYTCCGGENDSKMVWVSESMTEYYNDQSEQGYDADTKTFYSLECLHDDVVNTLLHDGSDVVCEEDGGDYQVAEDDDYDGSEDYNDHWDRENDHSDWGVADDFHSNGNNYNVGDYDGDDGEFEFDDDAIMDDDEDEGDDDFDDDEEFNDDEGEKELRGIMGREDDDEDGEERL